MNRIQQREHVARLTAAYDEGLLSRRDLFIAAASLGIATSAFTALRTHGVAQEATPAVSLGNYEGRTLRLSVALAGEEVDIFEEVVIDGFKSATNGEIELIKIEAADVIRTLQAQAGSGEVEIDMLTQDNNSLAPLVAEGLVEEIPEAAEIVPAQTIPALLDVLQFDAKYYFLPARPNVQIVYYNENLLNQWGVAPPKTWDELAAASQTMREQAGVGKLSIQAVPGGPLGVTVTQFLWQAGGDPLKINDPAGVQAFQFLQSLKDNLTPQYPTATFDTTNTYLLNESVALAENWPFGISVIVGEGGKQEIKTYEGWEGPAGNVRVLGGDVLGIATGTQNRDMALDFAKHFMSVEVQTQLTARLGWPAIREDAFGSVEDWQQPYFDTVRAALGFARARPNVTYWLQVEQILSDAFNDIVTNGGDAQSTLDSYQGQIDELAGGA